MELADLEFYKKCLREAGCLKIPVTGASMEPVLCDGDTIQIEAVDWQDIRKFDILVFYDCHSLVCHYVWKRASGYLLCRSLQFGTVDKVHPDKILGRSLIRMPWLNRIWTFL